nr:hypothetical protein [Tanacetum cinerariifolium]
MTGNLKLLCNLVEKFLDTVRFGNDQFASILGYGDLVQGNITINMVYYIKGLITISSQLANFVMRIWRLSHLIFDYINLLSKKDVVIGLPKLKYVKDQLCSSCKLSKAKRSSFKSKAVPSSKRRLNLLHMDLCGPIRVASINGKKYILSKAVPSSKGRLNLLHMDLCGPMRVASINGKKYILVIVDDYARYTWTLFLRSKDETPEVLNDFLTMIQRNLQAPVITARTNRGTEDGKNLDKMKEKGHQCILVGYSTQSKGYRVYNKRTRMIVKSIYIRFDEIKEVSETSFANNTSGLKKENNYKMMNLPILYVHRHKKKPSLPHITLGSSFDLTAFSDADHAECIDTRKITFGGIQFLGDKLVSWMSNKQNCTTMSSAEAEYVALSPYPEDRFKYLVRRISMMCLTPAELEVLAKESA